MNPVKELLLMLVLLLLVSARCELRRLDPDVEEDEEEKMLGTEAGAQQEETAASSAEGVKPKFRRGNWCAYVQKHVVTRSVKCAVERYSIKSQTPCSSGNPNCEMIMYKLSKRPLYTVEQKTVTDLQWRCCPGHSGDNCEVTASDSQSVTESTSQGPEPGGAPIHSPDVQDEQKKNQEQNDAQSYHYISQPPANLYNNQYVHQQPSQHLGAADVLLVPHIMDLVKSQLQPVLQGFNSSLERLSRQVEDLSRDVAQLNSSQKLQAFSGTAEMTESDDAVEERLDTKLDEVYDQIQEVREQMRSQITNMENRLHSQHAMLHYNLTSFKIDMDMKLKHQHKVLQVSLQAMNSTLSELKLDQRETTRVEPVDHLQPPSQQHADVSPLWQAIKRLDDMVVNNTVKVDGLMEDVDVTSGEAQQLRFDLKDLEKLINNTARRSQILFMETGLEVEEGKVSVLREVEELSRNISVHAKLLQELDVDMEYLYSTLYQNRSTANCNCKSLTLSLSRLEMVVANVSAQANENSLALEDGKPWANDWEPTMAVLQHNMQQVKKSLDLEQTKTSSLDQSLSQLNKSVIAVQAVVRGLEKRDRQVREEMQLLSGSFNSLLQDTSRHNDVLELLLSEEVQEFLEWPVQDQEGNSIPALKEELRNLQEQLNSRADDPSSVFFSDDGRSSTGGAVREHQRLHNTDRTHLDEDGSDLWNLEKLVEELRLKVHKLEEKSCSCPNSSSGKDVESDGADKKLQAEVMWLKRDLEEHLRTFKNVFSNADMLASSDATVELDKLWMLLKNRGGKKDKRQRGEREGPGSVRDGSKPGEEGKLRSRRDTGGASLPFGLPNDSLMFVASLSLSDDVVFYESSLNRGYFHPDTGALTAPVDGLYLFILTLELRPGPATVILRKTASGAAFLLHKQNVAAAETRPTTGLGLLRLKEGEQVMLELRGRASLASQDNVFTGLLLHSAT
ncbi:multimerin-2a isoform X1 [Cynoglossus semilaevis]|uniref:multimerin-2a isoform X1 n=1 Tax=Cynoglossus semilaevis TaxID=244447 RepID=UPI000D6256F0|nr:multimerin-2 isoform X1 [Cynoglossus semilaevis]